MREDLPTFGRPTTKSQNPRVGNLTLTLEVTNRFILIIFLRDNEFIKITLLPTDSNNSLDL